MDKALLEKLQDCDRTVSQERHDNPEGHQRALYCGRVRTEARKQYAAAGGRAESMKEYLATLPFRFVREQAKEKNGQDMSVRVELQLTGAQATKFCLFIEHGKLQVEPGCAVDTGKGTAEKPNGDPINTRVTMPGNIYLQLVNGEMSAARAYLGGDIHIEGNKGLVKKMAEILPPHEG